MTATRRLAAIMAIDVVGYSRLMGEDEGGTALAVREHRDAARPIVAGLGGRIVKTMGDGLLLEFPSVVAAVECAIAIQKLMVARNADVPEAKRIVYRIGVNLGDVLIEGEDILGEGVNIAARLEGICEPGGVLISGTAFDHVRGKIDANFVDLGEKQLKNIARAVRAYRAGVDQPNAILATAEVSRPSLALPDKPSIAVLAFQNMSGDPEQEYFADGMVEDIITGLSRIKWLFVIARNSSFVYKGKPVDVRQVGRELGVRYVLEGGVRKAGNRLRITAQLIEAETGAHLWADKYDGSLEDVFDLQDQITDKVIGIVEPNLKRSEIERSRQKRPESLDAYDLRLLAMFYMTPPTLDRIRIAAGLYQNALKLSPGYSAAHAGVGVCHHFCFMLAGFDEADRSTALRHARAAIANGGDDASALAVAAQVVAHLASDHPTALEAVERALALNPSSALVHFLGALVHAYSGNANAAITYANRGLRLSPFDTSAYVAYAALGIAAIQESRYNEAASHYARAAEASGGFIGNYLSQAVALALAGRKEEARAIVHRFVEPEPEFRFSRLYSLGFVQEIADKFAEGARLLGLAE